MANLLADPSLAALNVRLEQINQAVNGLPESPSLRSLEEKVRMLAGAVEHFAHKQEDHGTGVLGMVEERLDEISRAIVASAATAQASTFDTEPFERIEARITSLAHQIEELMDDRPSNALFGQMELLARRVDEVASRSQVPEKAMKRLAHQIADISDRLEHGQSAPDADHILRGIEQRFDMLSDASGSPSGRRRRAEPCALPRSRTPPRPGGCPSRPEGRGAGCRVRPSSWTPLTVASPISRCGWKNVQPRSPRPSARSRRA